jgi:hypothetical protein
VIAARGALPTALAVALAAACASKPHADVHRAEGFALRGSQPLRIAVLPFHDAVPGHGVLWYVSRPFVWVGRAVTLQFGGSMPTAAAAGSTMRHVLTARLQSEATAIVNVAEVDASLAQLGDKVPTDPVALARALDVDAVLEGEVRQIGASWYVFTTRRTLAGSVRLRSGTDGRELFTADVVVDNSAGIDHGPTGFVSLVAAPLAAIDAGPYTEMAIGWADTVARELLGSSPAGADVVAPTLAAVQVTASDKVLGPGDKVEVVIDGSAGLTATFDLGTLHRGIPMFVDGAPAAGQSRYRGVYHVRPGDRVQQAPVTVHLVEPGGGIAWRRAERLIDVDAVSNARTASADGR